MTDLKAKLNWWAENESGVSHHHHVGAIRMLRLLWPVIAAAARADVWPDDAALKNIFRELRELEARLEPEKS